MNKRYGGMAVAAGLLLSLSLFSSGAFGASVDPSPIAGGLFQVDIPSPTIKIKAPVAPGGTITSGEVTFSGIMVAHETVTLNSRQKGWTVRYDFFPPDVESATLVVFNTDSPDYWYAVATVDATSHPVSEKNWFFENNAGRYGDDEVLYGELGGGWYTVVDIMRGKTDPRLFKPDDFAGNNRSLGSYAELDPITLVLPVGNYCVFVYGEVGWFWYGSPYRFFSIGGGKG